MRNPFRKDRPEAEQSAPPTPLTPEQHDELRDLARSLVVPGFTDRRDVEESVEDYFTGTDGIDPRATAEAAPGIVAAVWAEREAELEAASGPDDHARLAAAFDALADQGVLGRMSFTCCQTCGTTEIDDERTPATPAEGSTYAFAEWAYTFFHQQDAERLADPGAALYLTFSAFRAAADADPADLAAARAGDPDARRRVTDHTDRAVGGLVRDALEAQGLAVTWDGTSGTRIQVAVPDWRRPLPVD